MLDAIFLVLFKPLKFFKQFFEDDNKYASQALFIVLIVAILSAISSYFGAAPMAELFPKGNPMGLISMLTTVISTLVMVFVFWLINGLIIRMAASKDVKPWAIAAYSISPQILLSTALIVIGALFPMNLPNIRLDIQDPVAFQEGMQRISNLMQTSFYGQSSRYLSYLGMAWSLLISFLGVRERAGNSKAITVTLILGTLSALFILLPILLKPVGG